MIYTLFGFDIVASEGAMHAAHQARSACRNRPLPSPHGFRKG